MTKPQYRDPYGIKNCSYCGARSCYDSCDKDGCSANCGGVALIYCACGTACHHGCHSSCYGGCGGTCGGTCSSGCSG